MRLIDADKLEADCNVYNAWDAQIVKEWLKDQPTVEAIPIEFIKCLYKQAIEYRNRWPRWSLAWRRGDEQAIGIDSVLQVWEDRNG